MTCTVCGKPASVVVKDGVAFCDKCAKVIVQEIEAEGK